MNTKEKIIDKLKGSNLLQNEMSFWTDVLENMSDESLDDILNFINLEDDGVRILTGNLITKTRALENNDLEQWAKALKSDQLVINSL